MNMTFEVDLVVIVVPFNIVLVTRSMLYFLDDGYVGPADDLQAKIPLFTPISATQNEITSIHHINAGRA